LGKWRQLAFILIFMLLLTAGLDYTGRNMYHALGGGRKYYAFLLPDLSDAQVVFCGHAYNEYRLEQIWSRRKVVLDDLLPAEQRDLLKRVFHALEDRLKL
jgi:hypothetical protein